MSRKSLVDLVFITNNRGTPEDFEAAYSRFPNWQEPSFMPPDILDWKNISLTTPDGEVVIGLIIAIGSDTFDIVSGVSGFRKAAGQAVMAIERAKSLGARVICFGAGTKKLVSMRQLRSLNGHGTFVYTNGDTLTAGVVSRQLVDDAAKMRIDLRSPSTSVALIGAYGVIGTELTRFLSEYGCRLILVGPRKNMLMKLQVGHNNVSLLTNVNQIKEPIDVLITATNHPDSVITPTQLRDWGEYILAIDVAEPPNISKDVVAALRGRMLRLDGGMVENNGLYYEGGSQLGIRDNQAFACLAEGLSVAYGMKKGRFSTDTLRLMTVDHCMIDTLNDLADNSGFRISPPEIFGQPVSPDVFKGWVATHDLCRV
jgi:predicted amino acid dehydrogenase